MGAAWLALMRAHRVVSIDAVAIRVVAKTAARLSIYRPEAGAVLAWEMCHRVQPADRQRRCPLG
jgi:hypothetical protein